MRLDLDLAALADLTDSERDAGRVELVHASADELLRELIAIAPTIGIRLDGTGQLADAEAARAAERAGGENDAARRDLLVWLSLYEAACVSTASSLFGSLTVSKKRSMLKEATVNSLAVGVGAGVGTTPVPVTVVSGLIVYVRKL